MARRSEVPPAPRSAEAAAASHARWSFSGPRKPLAAALGTSASRVSHLRGGSVTRGPVFKVCNLIMAVTDEDAARRLRDAVDAAWERRALQNVSDDVLLARGGYLWRRSHELVSRAHRLSAEYMLLEDRSGDYRRALRELGMCWSELADVIEELAARGLDPRPTILEAAR